jgi:hypothetical protein
MKGSRIMKWFWYPILAGLAVLMLCACYSTPITIVANGSGGRIDSPMPMWGDPVGYVAMDTPTTHSIAVYGVSKRGDIALGMGVGGAVVGGAFGGAFGAAAAGIGSGLLGTWLEGTNTDTLNGLVALAIKQRAAQTGDAATAAQVASVVPPVDAPAEVAAIPHLNSDQLQTLINAGTAELQKRGVTLPGN